MFADILAVFVVSLISSLFLSTSSVHGLPPASSALHMLPNSPSAASSSSLRLFNHRPVLSVDHQSDGDTSEMLMGESNEDDDDDDDSSLSSLDLFNKRLEYSLPSVSSKLLFRKLLHQEKRSSALQFNPHSAIVAARQIPSNGKSAVNVNQFEEPIRLSSSLKSLVESNPFARAWLAILLQKLMQEQHVPYIFKYGRRRK